MQVKPIRNKADYGEALQRIENLWGAAPGTADGGVLDVLITLVEAYEREHFPIDLPDPVEAIKFRLEQQGKDYRALIGVIGQRTRVYEVMRRDRPLAEVLIRPSTRRKKRVAITQARPKRKTA